jgi:uncharacterized membrane protein HdeD (DUF308 family)
MLNPDTDMTIGQIGRDLGIWLWITGVASIFLGGVALVFPFAATLASELIFGAVLVVLGVLQIVGPLASRPAGGVIWSLLVGAVTMLTGAVLLLYPLQGILTLTIVLAAFFIAGGVFKLIWSWSLRPGKPGKFGLHPVGGWGWITASGVMSLVLGGLLLFGLPATANWAIGLFLGLDLVFMGAIEIAFALAVGRIAKG